MDGEGSSGARAELVCAAHLDNKLLTERADVAVNYMFV